MAFKPGKSAWIMLDSVAGSGVDITAYADQMSLDQNMASHDTTVFGLNAETSVPGLTSAGASMSGPADVALGTFLSAVYDGQAAGSASSTLVYAPAGSVSGQIKQEAEVWVTAYTVNGGVGDRVAYSCSLQITGAVTNGTW
jgi:hypothetical protein